MICRKILTKLFSYPTSKSRMSFKILHINFDFIFNLRLIDKFTTQKFSYAHDRHLTESLFRSETETLQHIQKLNRISLTSQEASATF